MGNNPKKPVWVVNHPDGWAARREDSDRASGVFDTQQQAIDFARGIAQRDQTELIVQGRDGKIRQRDSFGNDPFPPKG